MKKLKKLGYVLVGTAVGSSAMAEGEAVYQPILDNLDVSPAIQAIVAAGVAIIGIYVARGSIMSLINMIRGAVR